MELDEPFMQEALRLAMKARAADEVPVGAVVVREGKVISRAYNQVELLKDATAHAEMLALTQAESAVGDWRLTDCDLYVTKEPCVMCAGALVHARLKRLVIEDRLELDEAAPVGVGQRFVADQFAPGECRAARIQHLLDRLGDQVKGPLGAVEFDLPALDAGEAGFQGASQSPYAGIAGHDFDQGRCGFELPNQPAEVGHRKEQ